MSQTKFQLKESGKPLHRIEIASSDGPAYDRLCKQLDELNKRVGRLENTIKKLETRNEVPKDRCTQTSISGSISFAKQKSLNIKLVDTNPQENDKTPKSSPTNKDSKLMTTSLPPARTPPMAATPINSYRKPQPPLIRASSQVEPFISRKNLASVAQTPSIQNGKGIDDTSSKQNVSPVKNYAQRYEDLARSQTNLNRIKSQSVTDVVTLLFDKRKSTPESRKVQLTLVPQNKDSLSRALSPPPIRNEVKSNSGSPAASQPQQPPPPPQSKPPSLVNGPPAAPPLPKSEIPPRSPSRNSEINGPSHDATLKSQSRNVEPVNAESHHDALMDQLKQFADTGFPFKRQITKQSHLKSNTWNFSTKGNKG